MRREFSTKVKVAAFERCGGRCEGCGVYLSPGKFAYDHALPDWLGGEPVLSNVQVLCTPCHSEKTHAADRPRIQKTKNQHAKHIGAQKSARPLPAGRSSPWKKTLSGKVVPRE
jgi:5-methylcytosine-specific restriction enzyme A